MAKRKARRLAVGTVLLALAVSGVAFSTHGRKKAAEVPIDRGIARRVSNFTLRDASGQPVTLYGFKGKKAVVITFMGTDCPVGDLYAPRLAELNRAYKDKGVAFLAVNSNAHETAEQAVEHAKAHGLDIPVLKDPGNVVADLLLVERTCETLVIDGRAQLRYRGAIDDQYARGSRKDAPTRHMLRDALDAVLDGRPVAVASTTVAGCLIDRVAPKPPALSNAARVRSAPAEVIRVHAELDKREAVKVGRVSFSADVAAIVQNKCQSCHRPGQSGPFSLLTFDDVRRHSAMIREVVDERRMPPWHADPRYGHFQNDRSLSARERATLLAWVDQGTPLGDPKAMPAPRSFPEGWSIGTPDVVFELPEPYIVAAQGTLDYVNTRVPTNFKEDVWVQAAEAVPGDRSVVHHIVVYLDDHGKDSDGGGRRGKHHLCGYAPGDMPSVYPPDTAKKIPAGSDLIFQLHYTPNGKQRIDRSKVGLIFAKSPVAHRAYTHGISQMRFIIPPETSDYTVNSSFTFPRDTHLIGFMPHMHLRGKSFEYRATFPDGTKEILLSVPAYDFGWQSSYVLAAPKAMPKGTRIDCEAHFDNSAANPSNPDPKRAVTWGDQTFEEMMIGYIDFIEDAPVSR
jgi:peroxiredoxin